MKFEIIGNLNNPLIMMLTGSFYPSSGLKYLYEKLKELLDNENKILDVRSKVKEYVNNKYNWDKVSEDTEKAYKALKSK